MYRVRVKIKDKIVEEFETEGKNTILSDAIKNGIDLSYSCKAGLCETCACRIDGECETNMESMVEGYKLTCQTKAKSDIVLIYD